MTGPVLVAYATRYGSTGEVAERIGSRLRARGLAVDVKNVRDAVPLDGYGAVVFGSPLYIGSMLKQGVAFLEGGRAALGRVPVAVFACGPLSADDDMEGARAQLHGALEKLGWLSPVSTAMFVGAYDPAKLRALDRLVAVPPASPLHGIGARDDRDWVAIEAWADEVAGALQS